MKPKIKRKSRPKRPERVVIKLKPGERRKVDDLIGQRGISARLFKRARVLKLIDEGQSAKAAAEAIGIDAETARRIARRYLDGGVDAAVFDAHRPGGTPMLDARAESQIVAMYVQSHLMGLHAGL